MSLHHQQSFLNLVCTTHLPQFLIPSCGIHKHHLLRSDNPLQSITTHHAGHVGGMLRAISIRHGHFNRVIIVLAGSTWYRYAICLLSMKRKGLEGFVRKRAEKILCVFDSGRELAFLKGEREQIVGSFIRDGMDHRFQSGGLIPGSLLIGLIGSDLRKISLISPISGLFSVSRVFRGQSVYSPNQPSSSLQAMWCSRR